MESLADITKAGLTAFPEFGHWRKRWYVFSDFESAVSTAGSGDWTAVVNGTGAVVTNAASAADDTVGSVSMALGTVATNNAAVRTGANILLLGRGAARFQAKFQVATLSDGTNTYTLRTGFIDSSTAECTDGVYFRYTHGTNSGKFEAVCRSNNVETTADTGITVATNGNYLVRIEINAAGTSAAFYIADTLVATITTNIPVATGRYTGTGIALLRTVGTGNIVPVGLDAMEAEVIYTTLRT